MADIKWYDISDLYTIKDYKITHKKDPATKWIRLPCVYKIKINDAIVEVGRSDTCKKHGGAEKVRKAIVNLLNVLDHNKSVTKTKRWEQSIIWFWFQAMFFIFSNKASSEITIIL